ncbi:hypothetical protein AGMMS49975_07000 [Clostridia bacterium]|nr:hypothetical protein AGMMS49975_07000 [Clostridia bacterium]GHU74289.1 hypothetical protein FACS1894188_02060 [Clostridia bacterium]
MATEVIKNYMNDCVEDALDDILKNMHSCTCDKCRLDVTAIALNSLPAKYVVTKKGELYTKIASLRQQFEVDIVAALSKAVVIVSKNPRHD